MVQYTLYISWVLTTFYQEEEILQRLKKTLKCTFEL